MTKGAVGNELQHGSRLLLEPAGSKGLNTHAWERSSRRDFDPVKAQALRRSSGVYSWVDMSGKPTDAPDGSAPSPADVLAGIR